jgi:hypothetical protein
MRYEQSRIADWGRHRRVVSRERPLRRERLPHFGSGILCCR